MYDWRSLARPEQLAPPGNWHIWLALAGRGWGKALDVATRLPTPTGWVVLRDVRAGDVLFDETGSICQVLAAHAPMVGRPCYMLTFDDGSSIIADGDHQWYTLTHAERRRGGRGHVRTTRQIASTVRRGPETNHAIPLAAPFQLPERSLPIDPYVLGVWLGDGDSRGAVLTTSTTDLDHFVTALRLAGYACGKPSRDPRSRETRRLTIGMGVPCRDATTGRWTPNGSLHSMLRTLGLLGHKRIPPEYLRASCAQRLELLRGLMDTDGHCDHRGQVEFCTTRSDLAAEIGELLVSLGIKAIVSKGRAVLRGRTVGSRYRYRWMSNTIVFRLPRKASRQRPLGRHAGRTTLRYIVSVRRVASRSVRCLTVDSPSRLFLCGQAAIPTHNTRTGAEWVRWRVERCGARRIGLIAAAPGDYRDVMVEGESGLLEVCPPWFRPRWQPSNRCVIWPNGAMAVCYSAETPRALRGPGFDTIWGDEFAKWRYPVETWNMAMFALRRKARPIIGEGGKQQLLVPQACLTTTPKPMPILKEILAEPSTVSTGGKTWDNAANLSEHFLEYARRKYEGTTLGDQELYAKILEEVSGALWQRKTSIDPHRVSRSPQLQSIVVAIDPPTSSKEGAAEAGIVVAGRAGDQGYVLDDLSDVLSPDKWATRAVNAYRTYQADAIVAEANSGGEMVLHTIRTVDRNANVIMVYATRGKRTRAEPVAALYEQGRVHHLGSLGDLEDQMCTWDATSGAESPDRLDALVWALTRLFRLDDDQALPETREPPSLVGEQPSYWGTL